MANISNQEAEDILLVTRREKGEAKPWAGPASKKFQGRQEIQDRDAEDSPWLMGFLWSCSEQIPQLSKFTFPMQWVCLTKSMLRTLICQTCRSQGYNVQNI